MSATRSRREELAYATYLRSLASDVCVFCAIKKDSEQLIEQTKYFKVIKNIFGYSLWDGMAVEDHIMVTPKKHTDSLDDMTDAQKVEYVNVISRYEQQGYNVYARAPVSSAKSIVHQHTHLIKTTGRSKRFILLLRKPYIRIVR